MIFEEIVVYNLFSYDGEHVVDLRGLDGHRNVALISGRNNFGKTNFLNSVKLLFTGVRDPELRKIGIPGRPIHPRNFVLGTPDIWDGLINKAARRRGENMGHVAIVWSENNRKVSARRSWTLLSNDYSEEIVVDAGGSRLTGGDAEDFLQDRLPSDFVPFFFFDGERIQTLADASDTSRAEQMERLLNISPLIVVSKQVGEVLRSLRKETLTQEARAAVSAAEANLADIRSRIAQAERDYNTAQEEVEDLNEESAKTQRALGRIWGAGSGADDELLKAEIARLDDQLGHEQDRIARELPREAVLLANLPLVRKARDLVEEVIAGRTNTESRLIRTLKATLAQSVFDAPPYSTPVLSDAQADFYKRKLLQQLSVYDSVEGGRKHEPLSVTTDAGRALLRKLSAFTEKGDDLRRSAARDLRAVSELKKQRQEKQNQLIDLGGLSQEAKSKLDALKRKLSKLVDDAANKKTEAEGLKRLVTQLRVQESEAEREIDRALAQNTIAARNDNKLRIAESLNKLFNDFRDELRRRKKEAIQDALNRHFTAIMDSNDRVAQIEVDDEFTLHYRDSSGDLVGKASVSAGTKQLIATALLWALKEVSGKPLPVIIDTPLARIDRENQQNLLVKYYPKVAEQVIVLPTDSEIDRDKYRCLSEFIYKEYALSNRDGKSTKIKPSPMYADLAAAREAANG